VQRRHRLVQMLDAVIHGHRIKVVGVWKSCDFSLKHWNARCSRVLDCSLVNIDSHRIPAEPSEVRDHRARSGSHVE
jgi:hypothetical protein